MDAVRALAELTELSSQIDDAVIVDGNGAVLASTFEDAARAKKVGDAALELGRAAGHAAAGGASLAQVHATLADGSVFLVTDGERTIAALTRPDPVAGLVLYDLKATLRAAGEPEPPAAKKPAPRKRPAATGAQKKSTPARKPPRKDADA